MASRIKRTLAGIVISGGLFVIPAAVAAQGPAAGELVTKVTGVELARILQDAGYKAKLGLDDSGDPEIETSMSGFNVNITTDFCEKGVGCGLFMCVAFIAGEDKGVKNPKITTENINKWHLNRYFGQVFVDSDEDLGVSVAFSTSGGVSPEFIANSFERCDSVFGEFDNAFGW